MPHVRPPTVPEARPGGRLRGGRRWCVTWNKSAASGAAANHVVHGDRWAFVVSPSGPPTEAPLVRGSTTGLRSRITARNRVGWAGVPPAARHFRRRPGTARRWGQANMMPGATGGYPGRRREGREGTRLSSVPDLAPDVRDPHDRPTGRSGRWLRPGMRCGCDLGSLRCSHGIHLYRSVRHGLGRSVDVSNQDCWVGLKGEALNPYPETALIQGSSPGVRDSDRQ